MESHEAMRLLVGGDAILMAKRIGRSSSLVQKWCEPSIDFTDSGAYNPLDRTNAMMEEAERLKKSTLEILAPVRYLATGRAMVIPIPKIQCNTANICRQTIRTIKEVGEALTEASKALEDDRLTPDERRQVLKEMDEALHALSKLQGMIRHG